MSSLIGSSRIAIANEVGVVALVDAEIWHIMIAIGVQRPVVGVKVPVVGAVVFRPRNGSDILVHLEQVVVDHGEGVEFLVRLEAAVDDGSADLIVAGVSERVGAILKVASLDGPLVVDWWEAWASENTERADEGCEQKRVYETASHFGGVNGLRSKSCAQGAKNREDDCGTVLSLFP